jgi:butyrate response factor 1
MVSVCPKRKKFNSLEEKKQFVEEYRRKYKTELCKNWELRGTCKFGDKV